MTRTVSETSLVPTPPPIQLENSQIVIQDEDENSHVLSIDEYCSNREVVNLENAAVNIDNSNDVIIGPVTQLNVNGNVTIYSNGNAPSEAVNGTALDQDQQSGTNFTNGGKQRI
uniref:Uncharacterized protein n=1 Tax=Anoplophora glabripennis TaxID=217634 RepID=V5I8A1_ANOGL